MKKINTSKVKNVQPTDEQLKQAVIDYGTGRGAKELAVLLSVTPHKIAGLKRSITCDKNRVTPVEHIAQVEPVKSAISQLKYNGKGKSIARNLMLELILPNLTGIPILSLCSHTCAIEKEVYQINPDQKFDTAENDKDTFLGELKTIVDNQLTNINPYFGDIHDLILKANESQYSHLILDFCGQLGTTHNIIKSAFERNIVAVGGYIFITLNNRGGDKSEDIDFNNKIFSSLNILNPKGENDYTSPVEHALKTLVNRLAGFNYAIIGEPLKYTDTARMIMITVKRVK